MSDVVLTGIDVSASVMTLAALADNRVFLATAYARLPPFERVATQVRGIPERTLIVRGLLGDFVDGASDIEVLRHAKEDGWKVFLNFRYHGKIFGFDDQWLIGSANITGSGLPQELDAGNIEVCTLLTDPEGSIWKWVGWLQGQSIYVSGYLIEAIIEEVDHAKKERRPSEVTVYSDSLLSLLADGMRPGLFTTELMWCSSPDQILSAEKDVEMPDDVRHDLALLGIQQTAVSSGQLGKLFRATKSFLWLINACGEESYFGELTAALHSVLKDDPKPYRKTVKVLLQNLLTWARWAAPTQIEVDQPKHSQRVRVVTPRP